MIDPHFLSLLRCPESGQPLKLAEAGLVRALNEKIAAGQMRNCGGAAVREACDGGLVREDGKRFYPIRDDIPALLIAEGLNI